MADLCLPELAVARRVHPLAVRSAAADALDLVYRLGRTWAKVVSLEAEVWVARRVAVMTRDLPLQVVHVVDAAVAEVITGHSPARVFDVVQAKIVEADPTAHAARLALQAGKRFVGFGRIDEHGLRVVIARVTAGDAFWIDATINRVADILAADPAAHGLTTQTPREVVRSIALGWLARPVELLTLLLAHPETDHTTPEPPPEPEPEDEDLDEAVDEDGGEPEDLDEAAEPVTAGPVTPERATTSVTDLLAAIRGLKVTRLRSRAVLYVHLSEAVLAGYATGVARVEGLCPHSMTQLRDLLTTADVIVKPVIDLADLVSTAAYEHPEAIKERIHLLRPGDQFPHATTMTTHTARTTDLDHAVPWHPDGPPDQTTSHTSQPLSRSHHRAKTHLGYTCTPTPTGEMIWTTPHGLHRVVDGTGTHPLTPDQAADWTSADDLSRALTRLHHRHTTGQHQLHLT